MVEGDDHCEAYTTIVWGRLSSRESYYAAEAEAVDKPKATCVDPLCEGLSLSRGRRPYHP